MVVLVCYGCSVNDSLMLLVAAMGADSPGMACTDMGGRKGRAGLGPGRLGSWLIADRTATLGKTLNQHIYESLTS